MSYIIHNDDTRDTITICDVSNNDVKIILNPYNKASVYAIKSKHTDKLYIGSTIKSLEDRFKQHKYDYKYYNCGNSSKYITSHEIIKHNDAYIELLETVNCINGSELKEHERRYYTIYKNNIVNKNRPMITNEEKKQYNKNRTNIIYYCDICDKQIKRRNKKIHNESLKHTYNLVIQNIEIDENTLIVQPSTGEVSQMILSSIV
jgi:hypothetical protein